MGLMSYLHVHVVDYESDTSAISECACARVQIRARELCVKVGVVVLSSTHPLSSIWSLWTKSNSGLELCTCQSSGACAKVEMAVLGSPSLIVLMVSVDVKQH